MKKPTGFPELHSGEHAVVFAEGMTGIVLSKAGSHAMKGDEIYFVFPSREAARDFVSRTVAEHPMREGVILDHEGNTIEVHRDDDALRAAAGERLRAVPWWKRLLG